MALDLQYGKDEKIRKNRTDFDEDAANYDRVRPRYCAVLFEEIARFVSSDRPKVLEIGPGTGQATESLLRMGGPVTAVELGEHLADYLRKSINPRKISLCGKGIFWTFRRRRPMIWSAALPPFTGFPV